MLYLYIVEVYMEFFGRNIEVKFFKIGVNVIYLFRDNRLDFLFFKFIWLELYVGISMNLYVVFIVVIGYNFCYLYM